MQVSDKIGAATRRAIVKAAAGVLAGSVLTGAAAGHPDGGDHDPSGDEFDGNQPDEVSSDDLGLVGYHSAGGVGPASFSGQPEDPHYGGLFELRVHDDIGIVSAFSARDETPDRGLAIFDVSDFTRAETDAELDSAEITLLSFVSNHNGAGAWMDAKLSDDGEYVFVSQQPYTAFFGEESAGTNGDNHSTDPDARGLLAIDIGDPGNPEVVAKGEGQDPLGPHNAWYHQIGGREYVLTNAGDVYEFHRDAPALELVSAWEYNGHDLVIQDDPKFGVPICYLSDWDGGLRLFDVSDPTVDDVTEHELGRFEMDRSHHSVPVPTLYDGKRLAVTGQENPSHDDGANVDGGQSGFLYLVDCDPIDAVIEGDTDGPVHLGTASDTIPESEWAGRDDLELDRWTLFESLETEYADVPGFGHEAEQVEDGEREEYNGFTDYELSPHNIDINPDGVVVCGHYHAGTRFLQIEKCGDGDDYGLEMIGYHRRFQPVPEESTLADITTGTPLHWSSVLRNGVAFTGGINGGLQFLRHAGSDRLEVGSDTPVDATVELDRDAGVYTASQTARIEVRVSADVPVRARVGLPPEWDVVAGDDHETRRIGDGPDGIAEYRTLVTFDGAHTDATLTLFATVPDETGTYRLGPTEYGRPDVDGDFGGGNNPSNRRWRKENGEVVDVTVVGVGT